LDIRKIVVIKIQEFLELFKNTNAKATNISTNTEATNVSSSMAALFELKYSQITVDAYYAALGWTLGQSLNTKPFSSCFRANKIERDFVSEDGEFNL